MIRQAGGGREGRGLFVLQTNKDRKASRGYHGGHIYLSCSHLDPGLGEVDLHGYLLPGVDVGVVSLLEGALELLQLGRGEGGPDAALLPLLCQDSLLARIHFVRKAWTMSVQ